MVVVYELDENFIAELETGEEVTPFVQDLDSKVSRIKDRLPEDAEEPIVEEVTVAAEQLPVDVGEAVPSPLAELTKQMVGETETSASVIVPVDNTGGATGFFEEDVPLAVPAPDTMPETEPSAPRNAPEWQVAQVRAANFSGVWIADSGTELVTANP